MTTEEVQVFRFDSEFNIVSHHLTKTVNDHYPIVCHLLGNDQRDRLQDQQDRLQDQQDRLQDQQDRLQDQQDRPQDQQDRPQDQRDRLQDQRDRLQDQRDRLQDQQDRLPEDRLQDQRDRLQEDKGDRLQDVVKREVSSTGVITLSAFNIQIFGISKISNQEVTTILSKV